MNLPALNLFFGSDFCYMLWFRTSIPELEMVFSNGSLVHYQCAVQSFLSNVQYDLPLIAPFRKHDLVQSNKCLSKNPTSRLPLGRTIRVARLFITIKVNWCDIIA